QWLANGVPVCLDPSEQRYPVIVSDGASGAIIAWGDERGQDDIYAQHINASGVAQWATDGVPVCTAAGSQFGDAYPGIIPDGFGGAILTWQDDRSVMFKYDVYAQRINSAGVAQWTFNGLAVCAIAGDHSRPVIAPDANGGAIISWVDSRAGSLDIYAQRVT